MYVKPSELKSHLTNKAKTNGARVLQQDARKCRKNIEHTVRILHFLTFDTKRKMLNREGR